jgi:simple sugar transport system ATP-binding protein
MAALMVGREISFKTEKPPANFGEVVLEVEDITVEDATHFTRVDNVSFTVRSGEIFAIAGVMGNGQSELADVLAGMIKAKSGRIVLNGQSITRHSTRERSLEGISYIPEDRHGVGLVRDSVVSENLGLKSSFRFPFSRRSILSQPAFEKHASRLMEEYDIRASQGPSTFTRQMSGGNQQKAIVAREIELDNNLLIFVQPTRGLDIGATMAIRERIVQQRQCGKAILLISLELDEVLALADTIGVLFEGRMQKIAPASELSRNIVGEYMMGVKQS